MKDFNLIATLISINKDKKIEHMFRLKDNNNR